MEDADERPEGDEDGVKCRRCGATGLHWQKVVSRDGKSERSVLFDEHIRQHQCNVADEFEAQR